MSENPQDRPTERRRQGPLGDEDATRQIRTRQTEDETNRDDEGATRRSGRRSRSESGETRTMGAVGGDDRESASASAPGGYFEAMEERQERLRDIYGGVDWLASFLGFLLALVGGAFLATISGLVIVPLGLAVDFSAATLGTAAITALVLMGVLLFLMYFFGGYVSGRLARFDGGLNGVMLVLWTALLGVLLVLAGSIFSGFLPTPVVDRIQGFFQNNLSPGFDNLVAQGAIGIGILVALILVILLGSFLGGRLGARYHSDIDYTL